MAEDRKERILQALRDQENVKWPAPEWIYLKDVGWTKISDIGGE